MLLLAWAAPAGAQEIRVLFPVDGLVLSPGYDASAARGTQLLLVGVAPPGWAVWVGGAKVDAVPPSGVEAPGLSVRLGPQRLQIDHVLGHEDLDAAAWVPFTCMLDLDQEVVDLEVVGTHDRQVALQTLVCYFRPGPARTWSITVDDAVDLFAQITRGRRRYASLFDHPTLAFLRRLHQRYGAVISLYLFRRGITYPSFDLEQMPARFRTEWQDNADWLRLGFHGAAMQPSEPYAQASGEQALADLAAIRQQVRRFAGDAVWDCFMRSHYWSGSTAACQVWQEAGIRAFYAAASERSSYYLNPRQNRLVSRCDWWRDHAEDHLFAQTDVWVERDFADPGSLSATSGQRVPAKLDSLLRQPWAAQVAQIFTHESFLLPHAAPWAVPDRLEEVAAWLSQRGYASRFDADDSFLTHLPPAPPQGLRLDEGPGRALTWSHRQKGCRYLVLRKDLTVPLGPWVQLGVAAERNFAGAFHAGNWAYRVVAVDTAGHRGGGSAPLRVKLLRNPDLDGDGKVNLKDFFTLSERMGEPSRAADPSQGVGDPCDLNADGRVDLQDFREFGALFGRSLGPARPVTGSD